MENLPWERGGPWQGVCFHWNMKGKVPEENGLEGVVVFQQDEF